MDISSFKKLADIFRDHGFNLYMVGGTSRDFLLHREFTDFDLATDAFPSESKTFLTNFDDTFEKYGMLKVKFENKTFEITTFRKEDDYRDRRHPNKVEFIRDIKTDYYRRDFTINALYIDANLNVYDFGSGKSDLQNYLIRIIGDPKLRIKEDPIRIIRAIRFSLLLDFDIEESLDLAMRHYAFLVSELNKDKVKQEIKKAIKSGIEEKAIKKTFQKYNLSFDL